MSTPNATTIGMAMTGALQRESTRPRPKLRNIPATMTMTMGNGTISMNHAASPVTPKTTMSTPVKR